MSQHFLPAVSLCHGLVLDSFTLVSSRRVEPMPRSYSGAQDRIGAVVVDRLQLT
jgi:hypothetical protein